MTRSQIVCSLVAGGALWCASTVLAQGTSNVALKVGDPAPQFTIKDDQGNDWNSADHYGKKIVVVYFYPADMTGGCTRQACGFRDDLAELSGVDVEVVGVSGDSARNHQLFKKAHNLNFTLLADTEGEVAKKFGVPFTVGEKIVNAEIDGKQESLVRNITTRRWTFVIGKDKAVRLKNEQVDAANDSQAVLQAVNALKN